MLVGIRVRASDPMHLWKLNMANTYAELDDLNYLWLPAKSSSDSFPLLLQLRI
jgi:hypothetical protein